MTDFAMITVMKMKEYEIYNPKHCIALRIRHPQNLPHFVCDVAKLPQGRATRTAELHAVAVVRDTAAGTQLGTAGRAVLRRTSRHAFC